MADISAALDAAEAEFSAALDAAEAEAAKAVKRVQDTVAALKAKVDALPAGSDPATVARIDKLTATLAALDPTDPAVLP